MNPLELAAQHIGQTASNPVLQDYLHTGGANLNPTQLAWCAAFVNSTLQQSGYQGSGSNMARSLLNVGQAVTTPQRGDIAVFGRGAPGSGLGHTGFVNSVNPDGTISLLAGNQGGKVSVATYNPANALGFRRLGDVAAGATAAPTYAMPAGTNGPGPIGQPGAKPGLSDMFAVSPPVAAIVDPGADTAAAFAQSQAVHQQQKIAAAQDEQARKQALFGGAPSAPVTPKPMANLSTMFA